MAKDTIFIPTYLSSVDYAPSRVQPRIFFYNSTKECESYYIASGSQVYEQERFPHFDNYSGTESTTGSLSLLFFNEEAAYGTAPTASLYNTYWEDYVELLYNPRTRLVNIKAIIPLAAYVDMELNDLVNFRSNTYHLRSLNNYNINTGEVDVQLLGPVSETVFGARVPKPIPPGTLPQPLEPFQPSL